jgi:DNA modification methylase
MSAIPAGSPPVPATGADLWPADKVERRPLLSLVPYAKNARTHSDAQVAQIAASIREWGWTTPVLVDETSNIIAGHGRVLAAQKLGLANVPVMVAVGWSEAQKRAYVIADNKLAENAGWDESILKLELAELKLGGLDLGLLGFDAPELGKLFRCEGKTDPDEVPEAPLIPVSRTGDLWVLGDHRVLCGDSTQPTDVAHLFDGARPHLMVTDPPYGVSYDPAWRARAGVNLNEKKLGKVENDDRADWREAWALFEGDVAYVWHAGVHAQTVAESLEAAGFAIRSQIIWAKDRFALSRGDYHWQHEPCWYAVREKAKGHWSGDRSQSTLWQIPSRDDDGHGHGTQKPVACMRRPILNNSVPGDAVYDPFLGSGTTLIAAEMEGRRCFGIEIDPAYVDVIVRRWQAYSGRAAHLDGTELSFALISQNRGMAPSPSTAGAEHAPA